MFRLHVACASQLQVFKEVQQRDAVTWWWVAVRFSIIWCCGCTCTKLVLFTEMPASEWSFQQKPGWWTPCSQPFGSPFIHYVIARMEKQAFIIDQFETWLCTVLALQISNTPAINSFQPVLRHTSNKHVSATISVHSSNKKKHTLLGVLAAADSCHTFLLLEESDSTEPN